MVSRSPPNPAYAARATLLSDKQASDTAVGVLLLNEQCLFERLRFSEAAVSTRALALAPDG